MAELTFSTFLKTFNEIYNGSSAIYHKLAKQFGLSDCAFWILYTLREGNTSPTQAELSDILCLSKQTVNSALKSLEKAGYIALSPGGKNRREKQIVFTPSGLSFLSHTVDLVFALEKRAFLQMSAAESEEFLRLSQKHFEGLRAESDAFLAAEEVTYADQTL